MIYVNEDILVSLEACHDSGKCNMFDYRSVVKWLSDNHHYKAAVWVHENAHDEYMNGIFEGFDVA